MSFLTYFQSVQYATLPVVAVMGLLGLLVGSFLNVVIIRLPKILENEWQGKAAPYSLFFPRSHCPQCQHPIQLRDNIPLLSYLFLKRHCRFCHTPISPQYFFVELLSSLLCLMVALRFGFTVQTFAACLLIWALLALSFIDLKHMILPDDITLPTLWVGLLFNSFGTFQDLPSAVWGAVLGYLLLWGVYWIFKGLTGKEGLGYGDFKLLALLGAWLGWQALPMIILFSSFLGALVGGIFLFLNKKSKNTPIPFGPFLAVAGIIVLLYNKEIMQAYYRLILT